MYNRDMASNNASQGVSRPTGWGPAQAGRLMTATNEIRNVRIIWDDTTGCEGWYSRHDEYEAGELLNVACDNALDAIDRDNPEAAIVETLAYFGGRVSRDDITVVS